MLLELAQVLAAAAAPAPPPRRGRRADRRHRLAARRRAGGRASRASRRTRSPGCSPPRCSKRSTTSPACAPFRPAASAAAASSRSAAASPISRWCWSTGSGSTIPTNSRGGAFDFFAIDPLLVERIEVARGAVSAVHGSDALVGRGQHPAARAGPGETGLTGAGERRQRGRCRPRARPQPWLGRAAACSPSAAGTTAAASISGSSLERRQALARIDQRIGGVEARALGLYADVDRARPSPRTAAGRCSRSTATRETGDFALRAGALSLRRSRGAALRPGLLLAYSEQEDATSRPAIAPGALDGVPALAADTRFSRFEAIADLGLRRAAR